MKHERLTETIIGCAMKSHHALAPGFLKSREYTPSPNATNPVPKTEAKQIPSPSTANPVNPVNPV